AAGVAVGLGVLARAQHLHAGAYGLHDGAAGLGVDVVHQHAVEGRAVGNAGIAAQRLVGGRPFVFEQRRIAVFPFVVAGHQAGARPGGGAVVDGIGDGLVEVGVYGVEVGLQGVDQGDVEAVLPDAGRAVFADAVFMPGAVGGKDEIVGAQRHLVAVD